MSMRNFLEEDYYLLLYQVVIAQWIAWLLATGKVMGSNPSKGQLILNQKEFI